MAESPTSSKPQLSSEMTLELEEEPLPDECVSKIKEVFDQMDVNKSELLEVDELAQKWITLEKTKGRRLEMSGKTFKRHSGAVKEFCKDAGKGLIQPEGQDAKEVQVESKHCGEDLLPGIAYLEADEKVTFEIHDHGGERVAGYVRAAEGLLKWQEASVEKMNTDECPMGVVSSLDKGYGKVRYKGHDNKVYHVFVYLADRENPVSGGADRPQALKRDERISFTLAPAGESQVEAQFIAAEWAITTADFEDPGENEADQSESTLMSELIRDFASKHCQDDKIDAKSFERFWQRLFNREFRKLHMVRQKMLDSAHEQLSGLKDGTITPRANFFAENRSSTVRTSQIRASNIKRQSSKDPHSPNNVLASAEGSSDNFNKGMSSCSDDGEEEELSPQQHAVKDVCRQIRAFTLCAPGEEERSTFIPTKVVSDLAVARLLGDLQDLSSPLSPTNSLKMRQSAMEEDPASNKRLAPMEGEKMGVDLFASKSPNAGVPQDRRSCTGATQHHIPELADADNTLRDFILELGPADEALKAVFEKATRHTTTGQGICESYIDFKLIVKEGTVAGNDTPLDDDHLKKCRTTLDKLKTAVDSVDADAAMNLPQNLIDAIDHLFARMDTEERLAIPKDDVQKMWGRIWGGNDKQITFVDGVTVIPKAFLYQQFNRELESMIEDEELDEDDDSVAEVIARIRVDDKIKEWFDFMDDNQSGTIEFEEERDFWRLFFETDEEAVAATKHTNGDNDSLTLEQLYLSFAAEKKDTGCNALLNKLDKMIMVATVYKKKMRSTDQHDSTVETWGLPQEVKDAVTKWFNLLDDNGNGRIDIDELEMFFKTYGMDGDDAKKTASAYHEEVALCPHGGEENSKKVGIPVEAFYAQTKKDLDSFDQAELIENLQGMVEVAQQMNQEQNEGKGCSETKEDGE